MTYERSGGILKSAAFILKMKKLLIAVLALTLFVAAIALGCSAAAVENIDESVEASTEIIEMEEEATQEPTAEPTEAVIEDMAGRSVTVPYKIKTVFGSNNNSTILLYTLASEMMVGWNLKFSDAAKKYLNEDVLDLPVLGNLYGNGKKANAEEIIALAPDIILITDVKIKDKTIAAADEMQDKLGIPVVVVNANLKNYDKAYEFLGGLLGVEEKAAVLMGYYKSAYEDAVKTSASIEEKVSVYYAMLDDGLTTEFAGSPNAELIELVGGVNIAQSAGGEVSGEVTLEQVLQWDPEAILVGHKGAAMSAGYEVIKTDEIWAEVSAVQNERVISVPRFPFNWFDRPPSVNRILGIKWLAEMLYPDLYDYDLNSEIKEFFNLFYGCELTDTDVENLLGK